MSSLLMRVRVGPGLLTLFLLELLRVVLMLLILTLMSFGRTSWVFIRGLMVLMLFLRLRLNLIDDLWVVINVGYWTLMVRDVCGMWPRLFGK